MKQIRITVDFIQTYRLVIAKIPVTLPLKVESFVHINVNYFSMDKVANYDNIFRSIMKVQIFFSTPSRGRCNWNT